MEMWDDDRDSQLDGGNDEALPLTSVRAGDSGASGSPDLGDSQREVVTGQPAPPLCRFCREPIEKHLNLGSGKLAQVCAKSTLTTFETGAAAQPLTPPQPPLADLFALFCESHQDTTLGSANVNDACPLCVMAKRAEVAEKEADDWKREHNIYRSAWLREIGGQIRNKHHEIDGFVLTTRELKEKADKYDQQAAPPSLTAPPSLLFCDYCGQNISMLPIAGNATTQGCSKSPHGQHGFTVKVSQGTSGRTMCTAEAMNLGGMYSTKPRALAAVELAPMLAACEDGLPGSELDDKEYWLAWAKLICSLPGIRVVRG
jgi:hypothetical protein